eukprot:scaffold349551_cov99-Cyclotella_meneghiniana.AAC.1
MTTPTTTINANAGIIATSLRETVFLSSTGDVLVCTTANHRHGLSMDNDDDYRPDGFGGNNLNGRENGVNYNSHRAALAGNDHGMTTTIMTANYNNNRHHDDNCCYKQKKSQQRPDVNVQSEEEVMACCCHPEGLCGGDNHVVVSVSSHSGEEEATTKLRLLSIDNNNHLTTSATATATAVDSVKQLNIPAAATQPFTSNADELKNKKGIVACTDSSDNITHHDENKDDRINNNTTTLSMKTMSTSIEEYDTFNRNANNMMPLGEEEADDLCNNDDSWYHNLAGDDTNNQHQQQQSSYNHISPTPIMSFDYSSYYEPSTPEHKPLLFGSGHEKEAMNNNNSSVGANGKKRNISMPNLFANPDNHHDAAAVNHIPLQQQTVTVKSSSDDPIRNSTIAQSKKTVPPSSSSLQNQQQSSSTTNYNNNNAMPLSSVPTFLNHLSQVTITRISAHPQGQHVLLVSNEGMLFSFGSNEHGQLGTGRNSRQHQQKQLQQQQYNDDAYYVKEPTLITPLLENGGKTVHCAAGVDYSLVVVRTERSRIMNANKNRRRQQQQQQFSSFQKKNAASSSSNNNTTTSTDTSTSPSSPTSASLKEFKTAHEQMYAFGCNDNNKLGLLDPEKKQTTTNEYEPSTRRRRRKNRDSTDSNTNDNIHSSPEPAELISSPTSTGLLDSPDSLASMASTDVYLPRRTALHCEVILKNDGSDYHHHAQQQFLHNHDTKVASSTTTPSSLPYGIVSVAAAKHHSAAVVKRPCGSVELYTWGRGEEGQLGLFTPPDNNSSTMDPSSSPSRGWESLCCTSMEHNTDASTLNSLIDEDVSLNGGVTKTQSHVSIATPHYVGRPTLVPSLSLLLSPEQSSHPPLHPPSKFRPHSPRKNHPKKNSPIKNGEQQQLSSVLVESEYVVKVALGHSCTHVVTSTGRWLVFGSNVNGLLALGGNITNAYQPVEVELPMAFGHEKVSSVSIGDTHGIALARSGRAFTWGTSSHDALGLGNKRFVPIPHPVHIPNPLRDTSLNLAISRHLVGESKTPTESQHNNGLEAEEASASSRMTDSNPVAYVHAGKDLSILILRSGSIHTCGVPSGRLSDDATPTEIFGGIQLWRRGS